MTLSEIELPSNKQFGFFFTGVFALAATYFFYIASLTWAYAFIAVSLLFLAITLVKSDALLILNKLWMRFGFLLSMIVSPIVFGIIFFGLFAPIAIVMRMSGRDELRVRLAETESYWISRSETIKPESFKHQF